MDNIELEKLYKRLEEEFSGGEYVEDTVSWYTNQIKLPLLTKEEEEILLYQIAQGDKRARKIFIQRNLRLVRFIAIKFINRGMPLTDLIQEGNIGLIKAVDEYSAKKDISFSGYAYCLIESSIKRAIDEKNRIISVPVYLINELKTYNKQVRYLSDILQRKPTQSEIAEYYNMEMEEVIKFEKINNDAYLMTDITSNCDNASEYIDYITIRSISQANRNDIDMSIEKDSLYEILENTKLSKNELLFLKLHYGLYGSKQYKQNQITKILDLSPQRISQIKFSSIKKLQKTAVRLKYIDKNE